MIHMEPNVVLRFCPLLDEFVKIRRFTQAEAASLLAGGAISSKRAYQQLVINASIVHYNDVVRSYLRSHTTAESARQIEEAFFKLSVDVNPCFDIAQVELPVTEDKPSGLHLLESARPEPARAGAPAVEKIEETLRRRVIGQREAIEAVVRSIRRATVGMRSLDRPVGTFFFVGRTGVGKTEMAKAINEALYCDLSHLIRVDCSEFAQPHEYAKLIGAPPGYVGHDQGGFLTEAMRKRGTGVVLFDEIEKADPRIHDVLLQILDEGFVTDSRGNGVSFREAIVILTSNLGVEEVEARLRERVGFNPKTQARLGRDQLLAETVSSLRKAFRPEFINRIDQVVLFRALTIGDCEEIVRLLLEEVRAHARRAALEVEFARSVPRHLAERGYSEEFGARELRRTVEDQVETPLSDLVLSGKAKAGAHITVSVRKDRLHFQRN